MESLGEWRGSGVLLHQPLVNRAIPEKLVPQSELICRRLSRLCFVCGVGLCLPRLRFIIGYSSTPIDPNRLVGVQKILVLQR